MQLIRIEAPNGIGIFMNSEYPYLDDISPYAGAKHMNFKEPYDDGLNLNKYNKNWFCGYKNITEFNQWLTKDDILSIINCGYNIFLIDVEEYQIGSEQIIYTKESIISKININNLFQ